MKQSDWINRPENKGRTAYIRAGQNGYSRGYKAGVEAAAKMVQKTVDENEDINSKQFDFLVMKIETAIRAMTD